MSEVGLSSGLELRVELGLQYTFHNFNFIKCVFSYRADIPRLSPAFSFSIPESAQSTQTKAAMLETKGSE